MAGRKGKGQIVSRQGLAELFGMSLNTVDHWVRTGCPVVQKGGPGKKWQFNTADVLGWRDDKAREEAGGATTKDEKALRLRGLEARTLRDELDLAKARAEVVPVEQYERALTMACAELRTGMRNVPGRAVRMLIGETDETRFKSVLLAEIDQALEGMANTRPFDEDDLEFDDEETE